MGGQSRVPSYHPQPMSPSARRAILASVALAVALLAAWLVPPLAVVVVWPILLVVPGWVAIAGLRSRIDAAGRLGLAVILTVAVSTHLVHWLSHLAGGYGRGVVFAVAALLGLALPLAAWRGVGRPTLRVAARGGCRRSTLRSWRPRWSAWCSGPGSGA